MKLQYQLNLAFTGLLIVILSVTGILIYSLILDILIKDEQRQLQQKGQILVNFLDQEYNSVQQFSQFLEEQDLQLFLYDRRNHVVLFSSMPLEVVQGFANQNYFTNDENRLWEYGKDKYVTSKILIYPQISGLELILLTPLTDLEKVRQSFIQSLFIVFLIGAIAAIVISYFLTNKLVTPLSSLKVQLKKIEQRQFDDIARVKATGEIKEVEQSVYDMANELQRYMRTQQTFFQNASHELKTPLMTIQGYAEGIRDGVFNADEKDQGLDVMVSEVKRLKKIINEMILLAKLDSESDVYQPTNVSLAQMINQVVARTLPIANEQEIDIQSDIREDMIIEVDEEKWLQALLNITINGIRHAKTVVRLTCQKNGQHIDVIIEDDGDGIEEELIPHIFHRFVRGQSGETGLGLAIARAIVEQSGGKIQVNRSDELGGAKFTITFYVK